MNEVKPINQKAVLFIGTDIWPKETMLRWRETWFEQNILQNFAMLDKTLFIHHYMKQEFAGLLSKHKTLSLPYKVSTCGFLRSNSFPTQLFYSKKQQHKDLNSCQFVCLCLFLYFLPSVISWRNCK